MRALARFCTALFAAAALVCLSLAVVITSAGLARADEDPLPPGVVGCSSACDACGTKNDDGSCKGIPPSGPSCDKSTNCDNCYCDEAHNCVCAHG
jgi:hypothetical protein